MLSGQLRLTPAEVGSAETCRLGKWYQAAAAGHGALPASQAVATPHAEVHRLAASAAEAFQRGQVERARGETHLLDQAGEGVVLALEALARSI